jgi:hypothetical protein
MEEVAEILPEMVQIFSEAKGRMIILESKQR